VERNAQRAAWVKRAEDGPWSSVHDYTGNLSDVPLTPSGLSVDRVGLAADPRRGKIQNSRFRMQGGYEDSRFKIQNSRLKIQGGMKIQDSKFKIQAAYG